MSGPCPLCGEPTGTIPHPHRVGEWLVPYCMGCLNDRIRRAARGEVLEALPSLADEWRSTAHDDDERWLSEEERNDWAVRDQLRASWILAQDDAELEINARARASALINSIPPGAPFCSWVPRWKPTDDQPVPPPCGAPGQRFVRLSGTWFCGEHDPSRPCGARDAQAPGWSCGRDPNHPGAHRFTRVVGAA